MSPADAAPSPPPDGLPRSSDDTFVRAQEVAREMVDIPPVAQEAYEQSLFEDMAETIVAQQAENSQLTEIASGKDNTIEGLERKTLTDALTGLPNREGWMQEVHQAMKEEKPLGIGFADLDGFKKLNDTLGHDVGDIALKKFADKLKGMFRINTEEPDHDAISHERLPLEEFEGVSGRAGGDEFKLMFKLEGRSNRDSQLSLPDRLIKVRERWNKAMSEFLDENPDLANEGLDVSVGFAVWMPGMDIEDTLRQADKFMYREKGKKSSTR